MSFLYPVFLLALIALVIPIIIHLFNFKRYKTLYFSNVPLLKLIKQESKKKSQLKQLLILTARLMAIISLVFAFCRPFIPLNNRSAGSSDQVVAIYIDNTFSMKAENEKGQLLEQAKLKAVEIANSYRTGTQFLLLTSDFLPQHQFILNKEQFIQEVSEIKESSRTATLAAVYTEADRLLIKSSKKSERTIYILSDFQKPGVNIETIKPDSAIWTNLLCFEPGKTNNLLIDSCWFETPGRKMAHQEKLFVHIKNMSGQAYQNIPVRLLINDSLKAIANINIAEQEESTIELNFANNSAGIQLCKVELDDYPIIYDNSYFFSYTVQRKINALGISNRLDEGSNYLKALFTDDDFVNYSEYTENNIQVSEIKNNQCIFLINNEKISSGFRNELVSWVKDGGSLVIFPKKLSNYDDYNNLLNSLNGKTIESFDSTSMEISEINYENDLYRNVFKKEEKSADLPVIKGYLKFANQQLKPEPVLLKYRNDRSALSTYSFGNGRVYTFTFPLNKLNFNFVKHLIFVPTVYNMVLNSVETQQYAYSIDNDEHVKLNQNLKISGDAKIRNLQTKDEYIAPIRTIGTGQKVISMEGISNEAGHFLVIDNDEPIQAISYNYSRKESVSEFYKADDLKKIIQSSGIKQFNVIEPSDSSFTETLQDLNNGKQLWRLFIILAFIFMLTEISIIRFWK